MADPITIPEERSPSYLNRHLLTGAKVGAIGALGLAAIANPLGAAASTALMTGLTGGALIACGAGIGSTSGKEMITRNIENGRVIRPPTLLNGGTLQGLINGALISVAAVAATVALAPGIAATIVGVLGVATTSLLGYHQGKSQQEHMASEYDAAKTKAFAHEQGTVSALIDQLQGKGKDNAPKIEAPKVTKEDMDKIESRIQGTRKETREWAEKVQMRDQHIAELEAARS